MKLQIPFKFVFIDPGREVFQVIYVGLQNESESTNLQDSSQDPIPINAKDLRAFGFVREPRSLAITTKSFHSVNAANLNLNHVGKSIYRSMSAHC